MQLETSYSSALNLKQARKGGSPKICRWRFSGTFARKWQADEFTDQWQVVLVKLNGGELKTSDGAAANGNLEDSYNLGAGNNSPRGVAADVTGNTVWVIDNDDLVYLHDNDGVLLRSWKATELSRPEGIATGGTDVWIVDRGNDGVHYFAGGATRSGNTGATSSFSSVAGNPRGITTDGTRLWVVDAGTDDVYKYTTSGTLVGSWALDSRNYFAPRNHDRSSQRE